MGGSTVRDVLKVESLKGSKVVAGIVGLDREVQAVNIGEILDIANWLHGGDFVHTTASFMQKSESGEIGEWTRRLVNSGAAALAIKTKRYIDEIPQIIIDIGNELDFPIIELPAHATQASINEDIMKLIMDYQAENLRRILEAQNYLMEAMLKGQGLKDVANMLTKLIGNPVLIESIDFKLLAAASTTEESRKLLKVRRSEEVLAGLKEKFSDISYDINKNNNMLNVIDMSQVELQAENSHCMQTILPILVSGKLCGFLTVFDLENKLGELDFSILRQSCLIIALELFRHEVSFAAEERARSEFLALFLGERKVNGQTIEENAEILGFEFRKPALAVIVKFCLPKAKSKLCNGTGFIVTRDMTQAVIEILSQTDDNVFVVGRNEDIVVFYHPQGSVGDPKVDERIWNLCKKIEATIKSKFIAVDTVIGMGRISDNLLDLKNSYDEAEKAILIAKKFHLNQTILDYRNLGYFRFLEAEVRDEKNGLQYCHDVLGKLIEYDELNQNDLIETLYSIAP